MRGASPTATRAAFGIVTQHEEDTEDLESLDGGAAVDLVRWFCPFRFAPADDVTGHVGAVGPVLTERRVSARLGLPCAPGEQGAARAQVCCYSLMPHSAMF